MKTITAEELKNRLDKNEVLLIDVREPTDIQANVLKVLASYRLVSSLQKGYLQNLSL